MKGKTFIKKAVSVFAAAAMSLSLVAGVPFDLIGTVVEVSASNACGENVTWTLENGTLTISGTGPMADYTYYLAGSPSPWFDSAGAITNVVIGDGVTSIGNFAFSQCTTLTSVTIPDSVTSIGSDAFQDCWVLGAVTIPSSVTSIGSNAFYMCQNLTSITIPSGVTSIGNQAFYGCYDLTTVTIPSSVTTIGNNAFAGCTDLETVNLPCNWNEETYTFNVSTSKADHNIKNSVCTVCGSTFPCGEHVTWTLDNGTLTISGTGAMADFDYGDTPWADSADAITKIVIGDGVTSIGRYAFGSCSNLTSVDIPTGVTSIGTYAFYNCSSLASVDIPASVTSIGSMAFNGCWGFEEEGSFRMPCGAFAYISCLNYGVNVVDLYHTDGCSHDSGFMWQCSASGSYMNIYGEGTFSGMGNDGESPEDTSITSSVGDKIEDCGLRIGYKVTSIDANAFEGCSDKITAVKAPDHFTVEELEKLFPNAEDHITLYETSSGSSGGGSSSTSRPSQPTVKGSNKTGWEGAVDAIDNAKDGDTVKVDMNNRTELPKNVLDEIKGKDVDLVLDMGGGIQWTINGTDVTDTKNINLGIRRTETGIPVNVINNITGEVETIQLALEHEGDFGFKATLSIALGNENNGLTANLMYYNPETKGLEYTHSSVIKNGRADLEFSHASVWAIIIDDHSLEGETMGDLAAGEGVKAEEIILG